MTIAPPALIILNLEFEPSAPVQLPHGLIACPLSTLKDESLFGGILDEPISKLLVKGRDFSHITVITAPTHDAAQAEGLLKRFSCLLSLHPCLPELGFDPSLLRPVLLSFERSGTALRTRDTVLMNGSPISKEAAHRYLIGQSLALPFVDPFIEDWTKDNWTDGSVRDEMFGLTLKYFLPIEDERFCRALGLFSLGIEQLSGSSHLIDSLGISSSLIVAAFETLFPTHGTQDVVKQFRAIGSMLVPREKMSTVFKEWYAIRSTEFHGGHEEDRRKQRRRLRLVRDVELAKSAFQCSCLQLLLLDGFSDRKLLNLRGVNALEDLVLFRDCLLDHIDAQLEETNDRICDRVLKREPVKHQDIRILLNPDDHTATSRKLLKVGLHFLKSLAEHRLADDEGFETPEDVRKLLQHLRKDMRPSSQQVREIAKQVLKEMLTFLDPSDASRSISGVDGAQFAGSWYATTTRQCGFEESQ